MNTSHSNKIIELLMQIRCLKQEEVELKKIELEIELANSYNKLSQNQIDHFNERINKVGNN